jgi:hypothetical protein
MDDQKEVPKGNLIARMGFLSNGSAGVLCQDFERALKEMGNVTISEWGQVVTFATDQLGFWEAEWLFSPAHCPNNFAAAEIDAWRLLWHVCADELVKKVPEVKDQLENQKSLILLRHSFQRRVNYNKTRPLEKVFAIVLAKISFAFKKLGLISIAQKLYGRSLYPKGTVGRTSE